MSMEIINLAIEEHIKTEVDKRIQENKNKTKDVIGNYIRLNSILKTYSEVMGVTPNGIKSFIESLGYIKMNEKNGKYEPVCKSKTINDKLYIDIEVARFLMKFNSVLFMVENNEIDGVVEKYKSQRDRFLLQAYEMANVEGKRMLEEFSQVRELLSSKLI